MSEPVVVLAVVGGVALLANAAMRRTAASLLLASPVLVVTGFAWLVGGPILLAVIGNPPSCQDGPCAWDETVDGPTPLRAQTWFLQLLWFGGSAVLLGLAVTLLAGGLGKLREPRSGA